MMGFINGVSPGFSGLLVEPTRADLALELQAAREAWKSLRLEGGGQALTFRDVFRQAERLGNGEKLDPLLDGLLVHLTQILRLSSEYVSQYHTLEDMAKAQDCLYQNQSRLPQERALVGQHLIDSARQSFRCDHLRQNMLDAFENVLLALESDHAPTLINTIAKELVPAWYDFLKAQLPSC